MYVLVNASPHEWLHCWLASIIFDGAISFEWRGEHLDGIRRIAELTYLMLARP